VNVTNKSRIEALQRQLSEQVERIQPGEDCRQTLHRAARADCSTSLGTAIEAGAPNVAIGA
jgi:hypothetical protein